MPASNQLITVRIMDGEYKVACPPEEIDDLQRAAAFLNERLGEVRASGRISGPERIAVMAGLNLAYELLKISREANAERELTRTQAERLLRLVDASLSKITEQPL